MIRYLCVVLAALAASLLGACGSSDSAAPAPPPATGPIEQPAVVNLYPNELPDSAARLTIMITSVGNVPVGMPAIFDTGSAGLTLYAPGIFPDSVVTTTGFVFPPGQSSMTYEGITVTNQNGTRTYGSTDPRAQNGNIGYATVTFGDAQGGLTTAVMPVFFYYSVTDLTTGEILAPPVQKGVFGVASTSGTIVLPGSVQGTADYPACSPQTDNTCYVVSVLKYLQFGQSLKAGFLLTPAPIQDCDITTPGGCAPAPILTLGLTSALEAGFSTLSLTCPPVGYAGPTPIAGYPVCGKFISDSTITVSGDTTGTVSGSLIFDTGTANMQIAVAAGSSFPSSVPPGSTVLMATPSGFTYDYTAGAGVFTTIVNTGTSLDSIVGIGYFTTHSFFIDLASGIEGWK